MSENAEIVARSSMVSVSVHIFVDIAQPSKPQLRNTLPVGEAIYASGLSGNKLYIGTRSAEVSVYDVSDINQPIHTADYHTVSTPHHIYMCNGLIVTLHSTGIETINPNTCDGTPESL